MATKEDLDKEIHSLKTKLGKAEARVADLEAQLASAASSAPAETSPVFGPGAIPLEAR
jgi:cell division septum initiation protein DivIVA